MISVESHGIWGKLQKLFNESANVKAAVAYVTDDTIIKFGSGDILVVDASSSSIAAGKTSAEVLKRAHQRGAKLYSCDTLHGKAIVFDSHAYIGSSNISLNSQNLLDEIGVFSNLPQIMSNTIQLIHGLEKVSVDIDDEFIRRICEIEVKAPPPRGGVPKNVKTKSPQTWLVSLRNDARYPGDEDCVEEVNSSVSTEGDEERAWFWMKPKSNFYKMANIGDSVVIIEREESKAKEPERVFRHSIIQDISLDSEANVKAYHYAFTDKYQISWSDFKKLATKSNIQNLGKGLNNVRSLNEKQSNLLFQLWS